MVISFEGIKLFQQYTRPQLAKMWGYSGYEALSRGVITPSGTNIIILFITKEKQSSFTQYTDHLEENTLFIEGETNHTSDNRLINVKVNGDQVHLFYRERHHQPFIYYGRIELQNFEIKKGAPSLFTFQVFSGMNDENLETELTTHGLIDDEFIPEDEGKRVLRQHYSYERSIKNRRKAIEIHGHKCLACGFDFDISYGREYANGYIEIHHIESLAKKERIINPETDLIPLCSNCHSMAHRRRGRIISLQELRQLLIL